mmetsp:Transcript_1657/g.3759  ORF Transcript_1657/g.3759 Transcript_1657/m.3759 type:complete len:238 (+) Transcript_1657:58-771(+)
MHLRSLVLPGIVEPAQGFIRLDVAVFCRYFKPLDGGDIARLCALAIQVQEAHDACRRRQAVSVQRRVLRSFVEPEKCLFAINALMAQSSVKVFSEFELSDGGAQHSGPFVRLVRARLIPLQIQEHPHRLQRRHVVNRRRTRDKCRDASAMYTGPDYSIAKGFGVGAKTVITSLPRHAMWNGAADRCEAAEGLVHVQSEMHGTDIGLLRQNGDTPCGAHAHQHVGHSGSAGQVRQNLG